MKKIKKPTQKYQDILTKLKIDYLKKNSALTSNFNGLPKINKYALISKAIAK